MKTAVFRKVIVVRSGDRPQPPKKTALEQGSFYMSDKERVEGEVGNWNAGVLKHPVARLQLFGRLASQSWSIEFLAAHLEAGCITAGLASSDNSPVALRRMFAYHYNLDNDKGWNDPAHPAYEGGLNVLDLMSEMSRLLYSED